MTLNALRGEERIGLALAVLAHAGLVALLVWRPPGAAVVAPPERIQVTIGEEVGLTSTSPEPAASPAPDIAPEIGEAAPPPAPHVVEPAPPRVEPAVSAPQPRPQPTPQPTPQPAPAPRPLPVAKPAPKPAPTPVPLPKAVPRTEPRIASRIAAPAPPLPGTGKPAKAQPLPGTTRTAAPKAAPVGGSRIGNDFLQGVQGAQAAGTSRNPPAAAIGPAVQSALSGAITRQLKPHWKIPQGADAELLVTILAFDLNPDGTLAAKPRVVRQEGITDANRAQAARHAEQAIRAVQLAAPFDLPPEYYSAWKRVTSFRFDRRLSQ